MSDLKELLNTADSFDVVKGILYNIYEMNEGHMFRCSISMFHNFIYGLCNENEYKHLFKDYLFEDKLTYHFSKRLQTDIINMEMAGLFGSCIDYDFILHKRLKITFEEYTQHKFNEGDLELLREMALRFKSFIPEKDWDVK